MISKRAMTILGVAFTPLCWVGNSMAATIVDGGVLNFTGKLVDAPCAVSVSSKTIDLGSVRIANFKGVDTLSPKVIPFTIDFNDCVMGTTANVSAQFDGVPDGKDTYLQLSSAAGQSPSAQNIGLIIVDSGGLPVSFSGANTTKKVFTDGENSLMFNAQYVQTKAGTVTAGSGNAVVSFKVSYD